MGLNNKSQRIRVWIDQLHCKTEMHRPSYEKAIRLLTYILGDIQSPKYANWIKTELAKVVAQRDLTPEQLKLYSSLTERIDKKFTSIQERATKRKEAKAAKKEAKAAKTQQTPAAVTAETPAPGGSRWA